MNGFWIKDRKNIMSGNGLFWSSFVRVFVVFPLSFFITTVRIFISLRIFMPVFSFSLGGGGIWHVDHVDQISWAERS